MTENKNKGTNINKRLNENVLANSSIKPDTFQIQNSNRTTTINNLLMNNNTATTASKASTQANTNSSINNTKLPASDKINTSLNSNYQSHHIHQYQKLQNYEDSMKFKHQLINEIVELVKENDHNSLAYLARTCGIPPQLRHLVWPILLKYHPFVLCPNIMTNTLQFSINHEQLKDESSVSDDETQNKQDKSKHADEKAEKLQIHNINWDYQPEDKPKDDLIHSIKKDISKYIMVKHEDTLLIETIIQCVTKFLQKWGKIFKYESGLTWVCLSLMEWCSPFPYENESETLNVLPGRSFYRSTHLHNPKSDTDSVVNGGAGFTTPNNERVLNKISRNLFLEYPLVGNISEVYADKNFNLLSQRTTFSELFEKTLLVFLHAPDLKTIIENKESKLSQDYSPVISGGDFNFNQNLFYKMFEDCFPDLYQPFIEQLSGVINTSQTSWMYYWLKFASVRTFNKSDRARFWDLMFGWRANPMNLDFFLKYKNDNLKITHFYKNEMPERWLTPQNLGDLSLKQQLDKYCNQNEDYFWFPDLNQMKLKKTTLDFYIFEELLKRNKQNEASSGDSLTPKSHERSVNTDAEVGDKDSDDRKKIENLNLASQVYNQTKKSNNLFPYSLIDIHTQQIFIYLTILHKNEFKLLEFEEREVLEFLNNVPILSKHDDLMFKHIASYTFDANHNNKFDFSDKDSLYSINSDHDLQNLVNANNRIETFNSNGTYYNTLLSPVSSNQSLNLFFSKPGSPKYEKVPSTNMLKISSEESALSSDMPDGPELNNLSLTYNNLATPQPNKLLNTRISQTAAPIKPPTNMRLMQNQELISANGSRLPSVSAKNINNNSKPGNSNMTNKKIEFGTDDKTLHSLNEVLTGSGDIWRKWAYQELEQNNI